jgi:hypothetical protein
MEHGRCDFLPSIIAHDTHVFQARRPDSLGISVTVEKRGCWTGEARPTPPYLSYFTEIPKEPAATGQLWDQT